MPLTARRLVVSIAALAMLAAGCGDDDDDVSAGGDSTDTAADATTTTAAEEPAGTVVELGDSEFGDILVDASGVTLYKFDNDEPTMPEPTCYDGCAQVWQPLLTEGEPSGGEGLDPALVGSVERTDGTTQVTYNDWPLYYFSEDAAAGDTNGQGVGDVWHVVGPDGVPLRG